MSSGPIVESVDLSKCLAVLIVENVEPYKIWLRVFVNEKLWLKTRAVYTYPKAITYHPTASLFT